jgi:tetratricopeptide (TPR) repeat protein
MDEFPAGRSFVQAALDAVSRAGMAPVDMRYFAARDGRPADYCRQRVRECEVYVAVIGFRYGSMVPGGAVSYTELEFDEAGAADLPRFVFLLDEPGGMPATLVDADRDAAEGFRQRVRNAGLVVRAFTSPAALELEVFHALIEVSVPSAVQEMALPASAGNVVPGPPPRGIAAATHTLPRDIASFTGRELEIESILAAVAGAGAGGVVDICAINGMAGIGKTALAVHVAHRLAGGFPGGQVFLQLHGHTPGHQPVNPVDALASLLQASGIPAQGIPDGLESRALLWRDRAAGRRMLLVLDNAASSGQVAPLLPGEAECLVLVTSRRHLGDLPGAVTPVFLDVLTSAQAVQMFTRLAPRAAGSPGEVAEVAQLAGFLPLAISLLARLFARHQSWALAELAAETRASLLTLAAEHESIAAAFEMSYRHLDTARQQMFCLLGQHPGATIEAYAAAALAGASLDEAAGLLDFLHGEGLLTEVGHRRYGMHDLLRRYARDHAAAAPADSSQRAVERLLDYYQHTAAAAEALLARQSRARPATTAPASAVPRLPDRDRALAWARAERGNLLACLDHATCAGQHARVVALTATVATLLRQDGPWADAITRHDTAVRAARQLGDRQGEAGAHSDLGTVRRLTADCRGAAAEAEAALTIYRDLGDRQGEGNALRDLGGIRWRTGDYPGATQATEAALAIYRDLGDRQGEGNAFRQLGIVGQLTGDYRGAAEAAEEALAIYRDLGNRQGQADALGELGEVRRRIGDCSGAALALEAALGIHRDLNDRQGQSDVLSALVALWRMTGDYPGAAEAAEEALGIARDLGHRQGQAIALNNWACVRRETGDHPGAARALEESLAICRDIGDRGGEAEVLNETGTLHRVRGDLDQAEAYYWQALHLAREIGGAADEAYALAGLGRCALAAGYTASGQASLRHAQEIFRRSGIITEASSVATELSALTNTGPPAPRTLNPPAHPASAG